MPLTTIQTLIAADRTEFDKAILAIGDYLSTPERRIPVRLALLGLCQGSNWAIAKRAYQELLPAGHERHFRFNENAIARFATGAFDPTDRRMAAYMALLVLHQLEIGPHLSATPQIADAFAVNDTLRTSASTCSSARPRFCSRPTTASIWPGSSVSSAGS